MEDLKVARVMLIVMACFFVIFIVLTIFTGPGIQVDPEQLQRAQMLEAIEDSMLKTFPNYEPLSDEDKKLFVEGRFMEIPRIKDLLKLIKDYEAAQQTK